MVNSVETLWDRDGGGDVPYQTRIIRGHFRIHIFWRGDRDPDPHDHPSWFWTFPLTSYVEEVMDPFDSHFTRRRVVKAWRLHFRGSHHTHRVLGAYYGWTIMGEPQFDPNTPIVTLGWWGKKKRDWGFMTQTCWVPWQDYVKNQRHKGWK